MKIKIFQESCMKVLEEEFNKFIKGKKVIDIKATEATFCHDEVDDSDESYTTIIVMYENKKRK